MLILIEISSRAESLFQFFISVNENWNLYYFLMGRFLNVKVKIKFCRELNIVSNIKFDRYLISFSTNFPNLVYFAISVRMVVNQC